MKTEPELTLEWCDEIWRQVPQEARKSVAESVKWVIEQDRARLQSSPASVAGGVPEFPSEEVIRRVGYTRPGSKAVQDFVTGWRCCWELASRLPATTSGEAGG